VLPGRDALTVKMSAEIVVNKVKAKVRSVMEEIILLDVIGNLRLNLRTG